MSDDNQIAAWLKAEVGIDATPFQCRAIEVLVAALGTGIYNLPVSWKRVEWKGDFVRLSLWGGLATWDFNALTRLVFSAHDACVRVHIDGAANKYLRLMLSDRARDGDTTQSHPTIASALAKWRETPNRWPTLSAHGG